MLQCIMSSTLPHSRQTWLDRLGLVGLAPKEPLLLAALVTGGPLLLIGAHGTAKTLLHTRVSASFRASVPLRQRLLA